MVTWPGPQVARDSDSEMFQPVCWLIVTPKIIFYFLTRFRHNYDLVTHSDPITNDITWSTIGFFFVEITDMAVLEEGSSSSDYKACAMLSCEILSFVPFI